MRKSKCDTPPSEANVFSQEEARRRFEATLRGALKTPPQPHQKADNPSKHPTAKERAASDAASSATAKTGQPDT